MALPPQMAVPDEMRYEVFLLIESHQPSRTPMTMTPITETTVNSMPSLPLLSDSMRFMPNPRPTTDA